MGRHRTHENAARTKMVTVRLREDTYDLISDHAAELGLSRASYLEHLAENRPIRIERSAAGSLSVPLLNELKRIGNNLNQLTHATNAGFPPDARSLIEVLNAIVRTMTSDAQLARRYDEARRSNSDQGARRAVAC